MIVSSRVRAREFDCFIATSGLTLGIAKPRRVTVASIQIAVAAYYGFSLNLLTHETRERRYAYPRQVAMYLARDLTHMSLPEIGRRFHRDHSTVIHAIKAVGKRINTDDHTASDLANLRLELNG